MQQINKITQPFPKTLALCYFGEVHDLNKALTKASMGI